MLKRFFDIFISLFGLIFLFPLLILIGILIKFDSSGPILFTQKRVGFRGSIFTIYKFRTMYHHSYSFLNLTVGNDNRITKIGFYLRKYKIDELPQLFNVLIGDMSFVGPRPEVEKYIEYYPVEIKEKVLSVKPGITDMASIEMIDESNILKRYENPEEAYIEKLLPKKQKFYIEYINNKSFFKDINIILKTLKKIILK